MATNNILRLKREVTERTRTREQDWQNRTARWYSTASRKVEVKQREDQEAEIAKKKKRRNI